MKAFLLISTELGLEEFVVNELKKIEGVKEAHVVYGVYDVVAEIEGKDMNELHEVTIKVRKVPHIRNVLVIPQR